MEYYKSEHVKINDINDHIKRAYDILEDYTFSVGIKDKEYLRLRLLTEEVLRLVKQILDNGSVELWFEGNNRVTRIIMESKEKPEVNNRDELGSIATSGTITDERGFFGKLKEMFVIKFPEEDAWSLKEYQRGLNLRKAEDKYSLDAWEDLERSLVANLADDIEIKEFDGFLRMVVTKDFTDILSYIPVNALELTTAQLTVGTGKDISGELEKADALISELRLDGKQALHAKLVFEETLGMLRQMTGNYRADIWFEKYKGYYCVKLTARTEMDLDKKKELLSLSSDKKNDSIKGFMDKVGDVIQNALLGCATADMYRDYGVGYVNLSEMGVYVNAEGIPGYGMMWSLNDYRNALGEKTEGENASDQAWDELEKSIVANLASDILVGVKGNKVEMTIICKM